MNVILAILALLGFVASASACYQAYGCNSACYWCGGGNYFPTYPPIFPTYGGGGGGAASASASASASGGGFGGYPFGGGGGSAAAAAAAAAAGGGASAASAAASAAGGGGGGGGYYRPMGFNPYWGGQYWDVSSDAAEQVTDKKSACAVLIEQYVDEPVLANDLVRVVNETFFAGNAKKIQSERHKQRNFTLDATPSTFHCCHVLYGNELLKKDGFIDDSLVESKDGVRVNETAARRQGRVINNNSKQLQGKADIKQKVPPQIYALPILPANMTCASLTDTLYEGLKAQLKGQGAATTTTQRSAERLQHQRKDLNNNKRQ